MKTKITIFITRLMFCFIILLTSCEKDLNDDVITSNPIKSTISLHKVSFFDVKKNIVLLKKLADIEKQTSKTNYRSISHNSVYDFHIDTEKGIRVENGSYHSYTFPVIRDVDNGLTENVVLSLNKDGSYKARLFQYSLTLEDKIKYLKNEFINFSKKTKYIDLEISSLNSRAALCAEYSTQQVSNSCSEGVHGSWNIADWSKCTADTWPSISTVTAVNWVECGGSADSADGNNTPIDGGISGSGSGDIANIPFGNTMLTSCIIDDVTDIITYFIVDISEQELLFLVNRINYTKAIKLRDFLVQNNFSWESRDFVKQMITQMMLNPSTQFDINTSYNSPFNINKVSITDATPEGAKFNFVYNTLLNSPTFKTLFTDLFGGSQTRFNVKFEIAEHVYEDNDPTKREVNATTSQDPVTNNMTIKISKKILIAGTTKSQTQIENAKTILHECIHAYLFVKAKYPATGVDFVKILNSSYPNANEQHDFIYSQMIPTMQKVLSEIRDLVTTAPKRAALEQFTMHPTINPMTSTPFNWQDFYRNLSLSGLDETNCFKQDFPDPSDALSLHVSYINSGKKELDR